MEIRIIDINPFELKLLDVNARYMKHETFKQLCENVKRDGALTSVPFACKDDEGKYVVLSGNHRVMAAREAGLESIQCMVTDDQLTHAQKVAIQLSHNSLVGEDDPVVLKQLYESIEDLDMKDYAGLDDKTLQMLDSVKTISISDVQLDFQTLNIVFLPEELERAKRVMEEIGGIISGDANWMGRLKDAERIREALDEIGSAHNIQNMATIFQVLLDLYERNKTQLQEGFAHLDDEDKRVNQRKHVPLSSITGTNKMPVSTGIKFTKAITKMVNEQRINKSEPHLALDILLDEYLSK